MNQFILLETTAAGAAPTGGFGPAGIMQLVLIVGMVALMYFLLIRPQKKRQKQEEKMRNEIQVGDTIVTIGGIVGKVITIKEDSIIIETGVDRCRLQLKKWSVQTNTTVHEDAA